MASGGFSMKGPAQRPKTSSSGGGSSFGGGGGGGGGSGGGDLKLDGNTICTLVVCCPIITCFVICCIIVLIPIITIASFLGNFSETKVEWNSPMSMVLAKSGSLNGLGKDFKVRFQGNSVANFPIDVWFVKETVPTVSDTRTIRYPPEIINTHDDAHFATWYFTFNSKVHVDWEYYSKRTDESLHALGMTQSQFDQFRENPADVIENVKFEREYRLRPGKTSVTYKPAINADSLNGRRYILTYFKDPREGRKRDFLGGNITFTVESNFFEKPNSRILADECEITGSFTSCTSKGLNWDYIIIQSQSFDDVNSEFVSAGEAVFYNYNVDSGKIVGIILGVIAAIVCCCIVCISIPVIVIVTIVVVKKNKDKNKGAATSTTAPPPPSTTQTAPPPPTTQPAPMQQYNPSYPQPQAPPMQPHPQQHFDPYAGHNMPPPHGQPPHGGYPPQQQYPPYPPQQQHPSYPPQQQYHV